MPFVCRKNSPGVQGLFTMHAVKVYEQGPLSEMDFQPKHWVKAAGQFERQLRTKYLLYAFD